jgi:hypothetical protein
VLTQGRQGEEFFLSVQDRDTVDKALLRSIWLRMGGGGALILVSAAALLAVLL